MKSISELTAHILVLLVVLLGTASCSRDSDEKGAAASTDQVVRALEHEKDSAPVRKDAVPPELPPSGEIVIVPTGETVTVLANQAPVTQLLKRLSRSFGFELVLLEFEDRPVEVLAVGATVGDVLAQALEGLPYAVRYGVRGGRSRLAWLAVGEGAERPNAERVGREDELRKKEEQKVATREKNELQSEGMQGEKGKKERRKRSEPLSPEDAERRARFLAGRAEREAVRRAETLEDLKSRDPDTREDAAQMLDPDIPSDVDRLADLVAYDEDFKVRVAAVEQLELSGSSTAVQAITGALWDPQPEVVVAAVKALRLLGDSSTVPMVQPLLEHENGEVREQAKALVELLEEHEPAE